MKTREPIEIMFGPGEILTGKTMNERGRFSSDTRASQPQADADFAPVSMETTKRGAIAALPGKSSPRLLVAPRTGLAVRILQS